MDRARDLHGKIGWPYVQDSQNIIINNKTINTKVTSGNINRDEAIYGPRVAISKVKMARKRPQHVQNVPCTPLTRLLLDHHNPEQIGVDFMFVNDDVFLATTSFIIKFISTINMQGSGATEAVNGL